MIPKVFIKEKKKLEVIKLESSEIIYNDQSFEMIVNPLTSQNNHSPPSNNTGKFLKFPSDETILLDCDQNYVECFRANGTIPNFEASEEKSIEIVLTYSLITNNLGYKLINSNILLKMLNQFSFQKKFSTRKSFECF